MSQQITNAVLQGRANAGLIVAFLLFLWLPAADSFLHLDPTPSLRENRTPARFPAFGTGLAAMRDFTSGFDSWFGDHFGFRRRLVGWERGWRWRLFHDGTVLRSARQQTVIVGKDGWLFLSTEKTLDDIRGVRPFSDAELESWHLLLTTRRDFLAQRGIRYLFIIPPDKHSVYPEHLPDWLAEAPRPRRRIAQFLAYMRSHGDVPILDLRDALLSLKPRGILYRQTDTHWNDFGALEASRTIVRAIAAMGIAITPPEPSAFTIARAELPRGDLAGILGGDLSLSDSGDLELSPLRLPQPFRLWREKGMLPKKWTPDSEPQISVNPAATANAVMFHDSFALPCAPFLGYSFARIVYVRQQNWDKRIFETEKPDIVIDEMIERFVISHDPDEIRKMDEHPEVQKVGIW
jgi:hypothetical protein